MQRTVHILTEEDLHPLGLCEIGQRTRGMAGDVNHLDLPFPQEDSLSRPCNLSVNRQGRKCPSIPQGPCDRIIAFLQESCIQGMGDNFTGGCVFDLLGPARVIVVAVGKEEILESGWIHAKLFDIRHDLMVMVPASGIHKGGMLPKAEEIDGSIFWRGVVSAPHLIDLIGDLHLCNRAFRPNLSMGLLYLRL